MKKYLLSLILFLGTVSAIVPAVAAPFVIAGSTYTFYIAGEQSGNAFRGLATFDGQAEASTRNGLTLVANESEVDLGGGQSQITFTLQANGSLFSIRDEQIFFGIGTEAVGSNGFDFSMNVNLLSAIVTLLDVNGNPFDVTPGLENSVDQTTPWNGLFLGPDNNLGLSGIDATRIGGIQVDFVVAGPNVEVPEPDSVLLCGIGLLAGLGVMRRRRHV